MLNYEGPQLIVCWHEQNAAFRLRRTGAVTSATTHSISGTARANCMKILAMGADGIGSYFGAKLKLAGEDVYFADRDEHLHALKADGLTVRGPEGEKTVSISSTDTPAEFAPYDLVLFCVKSYDTVSAARQLKGCLTPDAAIMTLQNGVENEATLCTIFPRAQVMGGDARVSAEIVAPGVLVHGDHGHIEFGELDGSETPHAALCRTLPASGNSRSADA